MTPKQKYQREYYLRHREHKTARAREHWHKNADRLRALARERHARNRDRDNAKCREWHRRHYVKKPPRVKLSQGVLRQHEREYNLKNRAKQKAALAAHYQKNKDRYIERRQRWAAENPEKRRAHGLAYRTRNAAKVQARLAARRAMKLKVTVNPVAVEDFIKRARSKPTFVCYYCRKRKSRRHLHIEHIHPLARGGAHAVENLCRSCSNCNHRKIDHLLTEWKKPGQQVLPL